MATASTSTSGRTTRTPRSSGSRRSTSAPTTLAATTLAEQPNPGLIVLRDPEGNEFWVLRS